MLDLKQIESFYPDHLKPFKRNLLREYLQYKILEAIFDSEFSSKLVFMGGTAIRMLHGNTRFSEDLDFDNLGLDIENFKILSRIVERQFKRQGLQPEIRVTAKKAFRCLIRFPRLLYEQQLSRLEEEVLLIQVDAEPQNFRYKPEKTVLNKFDVFLRIQVTPADILLAQKITCIFNRSRPMGRDFYDTVFLWGKTAPNMDYLKAKLGISDKAELKEKLTQHSKKLDFSALSRDLQPFLFEVGDIKKILLFPEFVESLKSMEDK